MKLFVIVGVLLSFALDSQALTCWVCENAHSNDNCLVRGRQVVCQDNQEACQTEVRRGSFGILITKRCKQALACDNNFIQNPRPAWFPSQCNGRTPSSVCRCCCNSDLCNRRTLDCIEIERPEDIPPLCDFVPTPANGKKNCSFSSLPLSNGTTVVEIGTECRFSCNPGFELVGPEASTCDMDQFEEKADFNRPPPTCQRTIQCPAQSAPSNGNVNCTGSINLGGVCSFKCKVGHKLIGNKDNQCNDDGDGDSVGEWSGPVPICQKPSCPVLINPNNGFVLCTNENSVSSRCRYSCLTAEGFEVFPNTSQTLTCLESETWNKPIPCCALSCPPFAVMDMVLVLDSSSSIGKDNWITMTTFVKTFISQFNFSTEFSRLSVIRYNAAVDNASQILLNSYVNNQDGLLRAFDRIPYVGEGTKTGNALQYVERELLKPGNGNRPGVQDILIVITDGKAQDGELLETEAKILRERKVITYAVGIEPPTRKLDQEQLTIIAGGKKDRVFVADDGFQGLKGLLDRELSREVCQNRCS